MVEQPVANNATANAPKSGDNLLEGIFKISSLSKIKTFSTSPEHGQQVVTSATFVRPSQETLSGALLHYEKL